mgnify:CR=1 FL=1
MPTSRSKSLYRTKVGPCHIVYRRRLEAAQPNHDGQPRDVTGTRPCLVNSEHISETMSNQHPTFPPSGSPGSSQESSLVGRALQGLSTRANLLALVVIAVFGTIAYAFASLGRYVHFG